MKVCRSTLFAVAAAPLAAVGFLSTASAQQPIVVEAPGDPVIRTAPVIINTQPVEQTAVEPAEEANLFDFQSNPPAPPTPAARPRFDQSEAASPSDYRQSKPTAAEIRQARALYRDRQRVARMERNLWLGYDPLRPRFNSIPMMTSRYAPRRVIYVPVYVRK